MSETVETIPVKSYDELEGYFLGKNFAFIHIASYSVNPLLLKHFLSLVANNPQVQIIIRGKDNENNIRALSQLDMKNVEIRVIEGQHNKLIITDSFCIFGSANFTYTGLHGIGNTENMTVIPKGHPQYKNFINQFNKLWSSATPLMKYIEAMNSEQSEKKIIAELLTML